MKILKSKVKNRIVILLLVIFSLTAWLFASSLPKKEVKADVMTTVDCNDRFSDREISDEWTLVNKTEESINFLDVQQNALFFAADFSAFLNQVCYKPYTMTGPCKVEFITLCEASNNGYIAFSAGNKNAGLGMPYASAAFIMAPTYAHLFAKDGDAIAVVESHVQYFSPMMTDYFGELVKTTFDFQAGKDKGYYDIVYTVETMDGVELGSYVYEDIAIDDGYFGFNSQYSRVGVTSFKVYEREEEKVNCDFTQSSILYPTTGSRESDWVACNFDEESLKVGTIATLDVSKVGMSAVYNTKYERPTTTKLEELFSLSVDVKTADMGVGVATGFEIGKSTVEAEGIFAGLTKDDKGEYYLVSFDGLTQNAIAVDESNVDGKTMSLIVYYDNTAVLSLGDTSLKLDCNVVEGYFALTSVDFYDSFAGEVGAKLDNFVYTRNAYKNSQGKDIGINFEGTKTVYEEAAGEYFTDYFINKKEWRMSSDVILPMYVDYGDGVARNNAITVVSRNYANTWFGPNEKYENFIARFDVTFTSDVDTQAQPIFGLQFGMETTDSTVGESAFLGFQSYPTFVNAEQKPLTYVVAQNAKLATGNGSEALCSDPFGVNQENIFQKDKTYSVMYVAQNNGVKVYLKESSQPDSAFEMLRGEIKGVNTQGYLQVLAMGNARFILDNFSIVNLDYNATSSEYNGNGYEILRSDFVMGDKLQNFTLKKAEYKDTSLLIKKGGYLLSNEKIKNNIFRFKTKATTGDVVFEEGALQIRFAASGEEILVAHNKTVQTFALDEKIDFDGALIEIYKMGNSVVISYVNSNQPISCIRNYQYEIEAENIFEDDIKLYAIDGSVELYSVALFDLKPSIAIATRNYDVAIDYKNPWPIKPFPPGTNQNGGAEATGCTASVASMAGTLFATVALVSIFVVRRRKDEKNQ